MNVFTQNISKTLYTKNNLQTTILMVIKLSHKILQLKFAFQLRLYWWIKAVR